MKYIFSILSFFIISNYNNVDLKQHTNSTYKTQEPKNYITILETVWNNEQTPIRLRDSLINIYGVDAKKVAFYQKKYRKNHKINIEIIKKILDTKKWPEHQFIGNQGNRTICNVLQHADLETREFYLPMMKQAVINKKLEARFLVRAEDRIATDKGNLQIYGGQMKYYPQTNSFNVWPVFDPVNIDKRRALIGLEPISQFLKNRFNFIWNLEEQINRTKQFEKEKLRH
jgi:hypothetical protein